MSPISAPALERPGARFSKVPKTFRARKAIRETPTCLICKAGLFICCIGNKNQNNCKVSCLETPSFWRYKENYVTRIAAEKSRDFWETGPRHLKKYPFLSFTSLLFTPVLAPFYVSHQLRAKRHKSNFAFFNHFFTNRPSHYDRKTIWRFRILQNTRANVRNFKTHVQMFTKLKTHV